MGSGFVIGEVEVVNEVSLAPSAALYDGAVTADGDLSVRVNGFYYDLAGTHGKYLGSVGNAVTDNSQNYVYLDGVGNLQISTVSYPASIHLRLARVITQSGIIVRIILERAFFTTGGSAASSSVKAGVLVPGSFSGSPQKATVTFGTPYGSTGYAVTLAVVTNGSKTFTPAVETKTTGGFVVNMHTNNIAGLVEVGWHTTLIGS